MNLKRYKRLVIFLGICGCIFAHPSPVTPIINTTSKLHGVDTAVVFNKSYAKTESFKITSLTTNNVQLLHREPNSQGTILPDVATQNASPVFKVNEEMMLP